VSAVLGEADGFGDYVAGDEGLEWFGDSVPFSEVLRDALRDEYSDASPEEMDSALESVLDSMTAAEAFNFANALKQIGGGISSALADPTVNQIVRAAAPVVAGAAGTFVGGPVGTALGSSLGTAAVNALLPPPRTATAPARVAPAPPAPAPPAPAQVAPAPPAAGGSAAAAQGLVLTQQPDVLKSLLSLAMGQHGKKSVNGIPVPAIMGMLSSVFEQAAADADELMYVASEDHDAMSEALSDWPTRSGRSLYPVFIDAENYELAEALESS
jgi:hypothetical protein